jgi:Tol biopolymer transport system component
MRARPHTTGRNLTGALALGLALALLAAVPAEAQYFRFGKNKVQYRTLDWHYLQTEHFDVYYYEPGGEALAAFTAEAAEDAYARIAALFDYRLTYRVPLLVYQSHNDFAVTNAMNLPAYAEGIGGATEPFKNRVALPFTGDYREYRRVLHHELVHAVTNDMRFGGTVQRLLQGGQRVRLPLWFSEGLAEYAAFGWDSHSDMYLREAVLADHLEPIPELYGYFAYRGGQGVFDYLAAQYGREKITELMRYLQAGASVEGAIRQGTGMDLDALSERWHAALRAVYFPEAAAREELDAIARPLATAEGGARYYAGATISPQGDRVAFLAARGALFDVYVVDASGEGRPRRLVEGQTRPEFESFRILTPSLSWDPSGDRLAVAVKAGPSDAIALVDARSGRARHYRVPGLDAILSVRWSPDGQRLAFSAVRQGQTDLYLLDLRTTEVRNLTADVFSDLAPAWTPDGQSLVFHSDRGDHVETARQQGGAFDMAGHDYSRFSLYRLRLDAPERLERLTRDPDWDDHSAAFGADPNRLLFVSDRNGVPNLYELDLETRAVRPLTDLLTGVTQVSLSADGHHAALIALKEGVPSVYLLRDPFSRRPEAPLAPTVWAQRVMGERVPRPAPALAVATNAIAEENPFLREATAPTPFAADPTRRLPDGALASLGIPPRVAPPGDDPVAPDSAAYGEVRVDFRSYDFSDAFEAAQAARREARREAARARLVPRGHRREDGSLQPRRYRLRFSPDLVYGNLGYDAIFGVQSVTQGTFSDLLGNHRLTAATNLVVDLRNSDYLLSYQYLPRRTDYALTGFHLARQLTDFNRQAVYRYRSYGLVAAAAYPLSKFQRVEAELSLQGVSLTDLVDPTFRARTRTFLLPALTYTVDATTPGLLAPSGGRRFAVRLSGSPGGEVAFASVLADARQYLGNGRYTLAMRASGGASVGRDRQRFYAAGVQNWLNPRFDGVPIRDENDFVFGTPVLPLRGHAFDAASAPAFALLNAEARAPLVAALLPGPLPVLPLYNIQAVAFADAGVLPEGDLRLWRRTPTDQLVFEDLYLGVGVGLRTIVIGYPLRLDWAWPFDGESFGEGRMYLSVGLDF